MPRLRGWKDHKWHASKRQLRLRAPRPAVTFGDIPVAEVVCAGALAEAHGGGEKRWFHSEKMMTLE